MFQFSLYNRRRHCTLRYRVHDVDGRSTQYSICVGVRHKMFSFWLNCSGNAVRLHYTGYYADRSYSVI